ncbi:MAG TPA: DNA-directed RNA polymerase subunit omega [Pyrinomonadaceae bacterium]|jgi:DNA-directed RNA polymerase subunit omega
MSRVVEAIHAAEKNSESPLMDSKYRLIIVAAQRSKQLQRGARPRVDLDPQKHKPTRIALEEVERGKVGFSVVDATAIPQE